MSSQRIEKLSVSVPAPLAKAVRERAGARGLSDFVARALKHELEHEQLGAYLDELAEELGPVPEEMMDEARAAWPRR